MSVHDVRAMVTALAVSTRNELLLEQSIGVPFEGGNFATVLQNGNEIFPAMLAAIDDAERRIDFCTFVYWQGEIAKTFATKLAARARDGVRVRVLLDSFGAKRMSDELIATMQDAGVELRWFRPLATWRLWRSDKRTHRKLLICDDVIGFTGGVGIATEWEGDARSPDEWRDTHLKLRGPAVTGLTAAFLDNWNEAGPWQFDDHVAMPRRHADDIRIQIVRASATIGWTNTAAMVRTLIAMSRRSLRLTTAYLCPDDTVVGLLKGARGRGVDVEILVPGQYTDSRLSQLAGHPTVEILLLAGVRIWRYDKTLLHSKVITVDGEIAAIGSANLNHRSLGKDEECTAVMLSPTIAAQLEQRFALDCKDATLLDAETWAKRGVWLQTKERLARLLIEQL